MCLIVLFIRLRAKSLARKGYSYTGDYYTMHRARDKYSRPSKRTEEYLKREATARKVALCAAPVSVASEEGSDAAAVLSLQKQDAILRISSGLRKEREKKRHRERVRQFKETEARRAALLADGKPGTLCIALGERATVTGVMPGSSAEKGGLLAGDRIVCVSHDMGRGGRAVSTEVDDSEAFYLASSPLSGVYSGMALQLTVLRTEAAQVAWAKDPRPSVEKRASTVHATVEVPVEVCDEDADGLLQDLEETLRAAEAQDSAAASMVHELLYDPASFRAAAEAAARKEAASASTGEEGVVAGDINVLQAHAVCQALSNRIGHAFTFTRKETEKIFFQADETYRGEVSFAALFPHMRAALCGKALALILAKRDN